MTRCAATLSEIGMSVRSRPVWCHGDERIGAMSWIDANKDWLFDGVVPAVIVATLGWFVGRRSQNRRRTKLAQQQSSGKASVNFQAGRDIRFGADRTKRDDE